MATTFIKIASVTVGAGGASSIDFTSIPSTYTDLCVKLSARTNRASFPEDYAKIEFNGLTTNLSSRILYGFGSSSGSTNDGSMVYGAVNGGSSTASTFGNAEYYIPNYAGSNYKSISVDSVTENNGTTAVVYVVAGLWSSTSAITSIKLLSYYSASFQQYTTATLYGIKNS
jgi:hypothetical protein